MKSRTASKPKKKSRRAPAMDYDRVKSDNVKRLLEL
jgi:hypothetical protein